MVEFYLRNKNLCDIIVNVYKSPFALDLYDQVSNERKHKNLPAITVHFISEEEALAIHQGVRAACVDMDRGIIKIRSDLSDNEKLASFIFELANLSQKHKKDEIDRDLNKGRFKSGEELARSVERMEFRTCEICDDILYRSAEGGYWDVTVKDSMYNLFDFNVYWKLAVKANHAKFYVDWYNKITH